MDANKTIDTAYFKEKLEKELELVTSELTKVGRINPENKNDWEPVAGGFESDVADPNDVADAIDAFGETTEISKQMEIRFNEIKAALALIEAGTYGVCRVCGTNIEPERLEANSSATTCSLHKQ